MAADSPVFLDTGPLVAFLERDDAHHDWAAHVANGLLQSSFTSEEVISEACFLLVRKKMKTEPLFELISNKSLVVAFDLQAGHAAVASLMNKYANLPMSLADASLVRMAELHEDSKVFTLDGHFRVYRMHGRRQIPLIIPESVK